MEILKWNFGERVDRYVEQLQSATLTNATFRNIADHPEVSSRCKRGCIDKGPEGICIYLNLQMPQEEAEETFCHELEHEELDYRGFNIGVQPKSRRLATICTTINSIYMDCLINKRLKDFGFQRDFQNVLIQFCQLVPAINDGPTFIDFALHVCYYFHVFDEPLRNQLEHFLMNYNENLLKTGLQLYNLSIRTGFETPEQYKSLLNVLISELGINDYVEIVNT